MYEKLETKEEPYNTKKTVDLFESDKDKTPKKESLFLVEKYVQKIWFLMKKNIKNYIVILLLYCLKCKQNTESVNRTVSKTNIEKTILLSKCFNESA